MRGVDFYYEYLRELEAKKGNSFNTCFGTVQYSTHLDKEGIAQGDALKGTVSRDFLLLVFS
jgi:hypothetical protein